MSVTRDDVKHIASLARLGLDEGKVASLVDELNQILGHMAVLEKVDTTHSLTDEVESRGHMPLRPDGGEQISLDRPREQFAPSMRDGFFLVPRLATHEDGEDS